MELALVLPLVAGLLLAIVQAGVLARDQILVTHAAREAVRAAAEQAGPLVTDRLDVEVVERGEVGGRVRVVVRYEAPTGVPLVGALVRDVMLDAAATMRVER